MKTKLKVILITILSLFYFNVAYSVCKKSYVCDDYGMNCKLIDICEKSWDVPSYNVPPVRPLPTWKVKPIPSVKVPPIGTRKCEWKQVNGQWKNICW